MQKLQALQLKFVWHSSAAESPKKKKKIQLIPKTFSRDQSPVWNVAYMSTNRPCAIFLTRESPAHLTQIMFTYTTYTTWCIFNTEDFIVYAFFNILWIPTLFGRIYSFHWSF